MLSPVPVCLPAFLRARVRLVDAPWRHEEFLDEDPTVSDVIKPSQEVLVLRHRPPAIAIGVELFSGGVGAT